jgi:GAF domain-containing protein
MRSIGFPEGLILVAPVEPSFCRFSVNTGRPLIVEDANADVRTTGDHAIELFKAVAVASYPIRDAEDNALGTFCVVDSRSHEWTAIDLQVLATLAKATSTEIALRRLQAELESAGRS